MLKALLALAVFSSAEAGTVDLPVAIGGAYAVPTVSLKEARFSTTVQQQFDFSCGSAALSTLLTHHYRHPVSEQAVFETMFHHGDQAKIRQEGFSMLDMKRFLEANGFEADGFDAPLDKLLEAGIPAIVLINQEGYDHFVVVKGLRDGRVLFGDPAGGTKAMKRADFEAMWVNRILFVVSNRQELARFNADVDWVVAPRAPVGHSVHRDGGVGVTIPKFGAGDF